MIDDVRRARGSGMAARWRQHDQRWETRVPIGRRSDGKTLYRSFMSSIPGDVGRREAERKRDEAVRQLSGGIILASERVTVDRYLDDWLRAIKPSVRESTWNRHRQHAANIVAFMGHIPVTRLTPESVERMLAESNLAPVTRNNMRAVLRQALFRALKHGSVTRNVAALAAPVKVEEHEPTILTPEQVRTLLEQVSDDRREALYVLAVSTGLRLGELLGLRWPDVDLEAGSLRVSMQMRNRRLEPPKTRKSRRMVGLSPSSVAALRRHRIRQEQQRRFLVRTDWGNTDELVFTNAMGGPVHGPHVTRELQRHLAAAGLPRLTFHALRHTAASLMLVAGVDEKVRREILGHSNKAMTAHYTHVLEPTLHDAARRVGELIGGNG